MKNIRKDQMKKCLVFTEDDLKEILSELFNDKVIDVIYEGEFFVCFNNLEIDQWYDEVIDKLNEYFDVNITSVHIDQCDFPLIWFVYKDV